MLERNFITAQTKVLCIIGHPIEHSMSPIMQNAALRDLGLNIVYIAYNINPGQLERAINGLKALGIMGFNVTIPYKESIIKYIDIIEPLANDIGAVNTVKNEDGILLGKNTDALGAKKGLLDAKCEIKGKNLLILGAGGAAKAIAYILANDANQLIITNRTEKKAIELANNLRKKVNIHVEGKNNSEKVLRKEIVKADILINTTPVGMYPKINQTPIPIDLLHSDLFVFDVIYNPLETILIKHAKMIGCKTLSGLDMLVNQGILAFEWWTNKKPNANLMKSKIIKILESK